jgi:large subunit ribosomal protein L9e
MKYVYAHFPINLVISKDSKTVEVKNYLGEKMERAVTLIGDTTAKLSKDIDGTKDEITVQGSSLDAVSQSCANIQQVRIHALCTTDNNFLEIAAWVY